jgi:uncharacterized protein YwlG (UPF0340 family)
MLQHAEKSAMPRQKAGSTMCRAKNSEGFIVQCCETVHNAILLERPEADKNRIPVFRSVSGQVN